MDSFSLYNVQGAYSLSVTTEEAIESSSALKDLVLKTLESNEEIVRRLEGFQAATAAPSVNAETRTIIKGANDNESVQNEASGNDHIDTVADVKATAFSFTFDRELQSTRVYGRVADRQSSLSLPSSTGRSRGWSFLSEVTLSDVSNISVVSLPISVTELYGDIDQSLHQIFRKDEIISQNLQACCAVEIVDKFPVTGIAGGSAVRWLSCQIEPWMYETLVQLLGDELAGDSILLLRFADLANIVTNLPQQEQLWSEIQRLQKHLLEGASILGIGPSSTWEIIKQKRLATPTAIDERFPSLATNVDNEHVGDIDRIGANTRCNPTPTPASSSPQHSIAKLENYLQKAVQPLHGFRFASSDEILSWLPFRSSRVPRSSEPHFPV
ncbi:MAG: hypothetical protein Q9191_001182 [Dirinaria sp. TL-2023a]